jgi:hypothetical protein
MHVDVTLGGVEALALALSVEIFLDVLEQADLREISVVDGLVGYQLNNDALLLRLRSAL